MPAKSSKTTSSSKGGSSKSILEAQVTAQIFGFTYRKPDAVTKEDIQIVEDHKKDKKYVDDNLFPMEEIFASLRQYKEDKSKEMVNPRLMYTEGSAAGKHKKLRKKPGEEIINLHAINVPGSIAEASVIKAAESILSNHGIKKIKVLINNIGNIESQAAYTKEATSYYRKNIADLNSTCRQLFKESLHALITKGSGMCKEIHDEAPKPMEFLDDESRKRFSEVVEFLETMGIEYEIDQSILGDTNYSTNTVFKIIDEGTNKTVGAGSRYDSLARKCGLRKDIPSVGITINVPKPKKSKTRSLAKIEKAKFFFMQIGFEAKLHSLSLIDQLQKENVYVLHKLYRDKLSTQISSARKSSADYYIIMGQKEAMENDLIVRDKESHSQYIIDNRNIVDYLKKL